jgi:hypothetical protein
MNQLVNLTRIDAKGIVTKEELFNWIVDLNQEQFDSLCNEIISLYKFQQTYEGALVTDEEDMLKPWLPVLPRIVFSIDNFGVGYQKTHFYKYLEYISEKEMSSMCDEILSLYSHARENNNTYIISQVFPAVAGHIESWRVHYKPVKMFSNLPDQIMHWRSIMSMA